MPLIRLPLEDTKQNYLSWFWQWVALMARGDYQSAADAVHWPSYQRETGESLARRLTTFFGGDEPWSVVIPNDRLVGVIDESAEWDPPAGAATRDGQGWVMAQIPLTTEPADPKDDAIPLMGLAVSFFVKRDDDAYVMVFEIFHA